MILVFASFAVERYLVCVCFGLLFLVLTEKNK